MARKRKTRKYKLGKRLEKAYANYSARYDKKEAELRKQGLEMLAPKMTPSAYGMVRNAYIEKGQTTNINQTIVRDQAYAYSYKTAKRIKKALDKYDSENKISLMDIRRGANASVNVSKINSELNEMTDEEKEALFNELLPSTVSHTNQGFISYYVFGSE